MESIKYVRPGELELTVEQRRAASIAEIKASFPGIDRELVSDSWLGRALAAERRIAEPAP